jgi:hypothetical protein
MRPFDGGATHVVSDNDLDMQHALLTGRLSSGIWHPSGRPTGLGAVTVRRDHS